MRNKALQLFFGIGMKTPDAPRNRPAIYRGFSRGREGEKRQAPEFLDAYQIATCGAVAEIIPCQG
jgi:hypothetical protein